MGSDVGKRHRMTARCSGQRLLRGLAFSLPLSAVACGSDAISVTRGPVGGRHALDSGRRAPPATTLPTTSAPAVGTPCRWLAPGAAVDVAYSPDGKLVGTASGSFVKLYDAATGAAVRAMPWMFAGV